MVAVGNDYRFVLGFVVACDGTCFLGEMYLFLVPFFRIAFVGTLAGVVTELAALETCDFVDFSVGCCCWLFVIFLQVLGASDDGGFLLLLPWVFLCLVCRLPGDCSKRDG